MTNEARHEYVELRPPAGLAERVMCFWTQRIAADGGRCRHPVLPDGCVDIVWMDDVPPFIAGPATRRVLVDLPAGAKLIGVRFNPGWAACSLGVPAHLLLNKDVPLAEVWTKPVARFIDPWALRDRFSASEPADPAVRLAVAKLAAHPAATVHEVARLTGLSARHLHRRFRHAVGYGPKTFQRIMRFQRCASSRRTRRRTSWGGPTAP